MLKIENMSCGYHGRVILENIGLLIADNQITGIIGPNGSGKTTLLRAVTKIIPLTRGKVFFKGADLAGVSFKKLAQEIALARNDTELPVDISVEDFTALGRIPHQPSWQFLESAADMRIVERVLDLVGMADSRKKLLAELSAGERQLIIIARALAQEPKLLLLDEPIVHLDIAHQVYILELIKRLQKENKLNIIIVLHELNLAAEYCDQLILLDKGRVYKSGSPAEVLQKDNIEKVYRTSVSVGENPLSKSPVVFVTAKAKRED